MNAFYKTYKLGNSPSYQWRLLKLTAEDLVKEDPINIIVIGDRSGKICKFLLDTSEKISVVRICENQVDVSLHSYEDRIQYLYNKHFEVSDLIGRQTANMVVVADEKNYSYVKLAVELYQEKLKPTAHLSIYNSRQIDKNTEKSKLWDLPVSLTDSNNWEIIGESYSLTSLKRIN